jgi:antitoxin component YwqK of YwqJK toxin-antitoxin module
MDFLIPDLNDIVFSYLRETKVSISWDKLETKKMMICNVQDGITNTYFNNGQLHKKEIYQMGKFISSQTYSMLKHKNTYTYKNLNLIYHKNNYINTFCELALSAFSVGNIEYIFHRTGYLSCIKRTQHIYIHYIYFRNNGNIQHMCRTKNGNNDGYFASYNEQNKRTNLILYKNGILIDGLIPVY